MRGGPQTRQKHRRGHPQAGRDLRGGRARLHQLQHLLREPPADRAGPVAAFPLDGDQLGDAVEQVEALVRPLPGVRLDGQQPVGQDTLPHVPHVPHVPGDLGGLSDLRGTPAAADREQRVRHWAHVHPVRSAPGRADRRQVLRRELRAHLGRQARAGRLRTRDEPAGGGQDPRAQVQVGAEQIQDDVRAAAGRARGHHPAVPVDDGREVPGALARHLPHDVLGDRREGHRLVHREQRQPVPGAGRGQVLGDVAELRLAGREGGHAGLRQEPHERLGVRRVPTPGQTRQHQLAAGEIPAGIPQIGGHDAPHRAVQFVLAAEEPEAQRIGVQKCAQPHLVAAVLCLEIYDES
ncbi:hypothetical protein QFZ56_006002 [Streptomyces achromogenes]|uniref:Uncharacterized protein n=1 Tax=Streptomyces achromogenes TaxID=67255 RepID=A0ABU0Q8P7_STRAH|nr:hypothetical protein [Streptomyces achromogenes]